MLKALTHTFIYVLDQDEALDFYVGKLGLEVRTDADLGFMRWLTLKGVEFTQEPTEHFYGIDCGLRDPFGNPLRLTQPAPGPIEVPSPGELANAE